MNIVMGLLYALHPFYPFRRSQRSEIGQFYLWGHLEPQLLCWHCDRNVKFPNCMRDPVEHGLRGKTMFYTLQHAPPQSSS